MSKITALLMLAFAVLAAAPALAQEQPPAPVRFVDVTLGDQLVITVPEDWLIWRVEDYASEDAADQAVVDLINSVGSSAVAERPYVNPVLKAVAVMPEPTADNGIVALRVETVPLSTLLASSDAQPSDVQPSRIMEVTGNQVVQNLAVGGVPASFGVNPTLNIPVAAYVFAEQDLIVQLHLIADRPWLSANADVATVMLSSLRARGRILDTEAFPALTGRPFPSTVALPASALIPSVESTQAPPAPSPEPPPSITGAELMAVCEDGVSEIAFVAYQSNTLTEIGLMNADGSNPRRLTENTAHDQAISWSPDGTRLVFMTNRDGNWQIYTMNPDGSDPRNLTNDDGTHLFPAWSPDGTRIAYVTQLSGQTDIWVMNADGSNRQQLTTSDSQESYPAWSPDGTQIAFELVFDENKDLYVMNANGGNVRRLTTTEEAIDALPLWTPDGQQIVFTTDRDGNPEIYIMNADGSDQRNLTNSATPDAASSVSPDGQFIGGFMAVNQVAHAFVIRADGSERVQLTEGTTSVEDVSWRPCAGTVVLPPVEAEAAAPPDNQCMIAAPINVNFRVSPSTNAEVLGMFMGGTSLAATGQTPGVDGYVWWQLENGAWVRSDVVGEVGNCSAVPILTP